MTVLSRRSLLATTPALLLAGCTAAQQAAIIAAYNNFLSQVQAIVSTGCGIVTGFIPTVNSIEAVVAILYPGVGTAVAGIVGSVEAVATALCGAATGTPPLTVRRRLISKVPVVIGTIVVNGQPVQVTGYR